MVVDHQTEGSNQQKTQLRRVLGLANCTSLIIGSIIGTGIFVSPTSVLQHSGSVGISLVVWVLCGCVSILGALTFVELGLLVPESGAEYSYILRGFENLHPFWGPLPSFLTCWLQVLLLRPSNVAVCCLIFAEYGVAMFFGDCHNGYQDLCKRLLAICALGVITAVNVYSVKVYVKLQGLFTVCKLAACGVVICGGIYQLSIGESRNVFSMEHLGSKSTNVGDIAVAFFGGLYAFGGWTALNDVTEEVVHPERNILRSILIALPVITLVYCFINIAYLTVLSPQEMIHSSAVAVDFGVRLLGNFKFILPLGVLLSAFGSGLNSQFSISRLCYVAGRQGHLMTILSFVHTTRVTPVAAVISQSLLAFLFILSGEVLALINFIGFVAWLFNGLAMVALIMLRRQPQKERKIVFKTPIFIPCFLILVSIFLSITPVVMNPTVEYLSVLVLLLAGFLAYTIFVYNHAIPVRYSVKATKILQYLMEIVPPEK